MSIIKCSKCNVGVLKCFVSIQEEYKREKGVLKLFVSIEDV